MKGDEEDGDFEVVVGDKAFAKAKVGDHMAHAREGK